MNKMNLFTSICVQFILMQFLTQLIEINCIPLQSLKTNEEILIIVSYDAFRNEYFQRNVTPNMLEFRRQGVYADYIVNVFPTKTFTNHHSISTGLYPEKHGVTANDVYDTKLSRHLKYGYDLFHYNKDVLPIWTLNEKNGGTSGCMMWPGSNFEYQNINCTYTASYNSSIPMKSRIDTVISWLQNGTKRPNLVMVYFEMADKIGHAYGPDSQQVTDVVKDLDEITKYLQDELKKIDLLHKTNIIQLSDHGMEGVTSAKFINLTDFLEPDEATMYGTSPVLQVVPKDGKEEDVYTRLKNAAAKNGNFKVYKTKELPERWHSNNTQRFGPIIVLAELGYAFQDMYDAAKYYKKEYNISFTPETQYGVHGYDNALPIMHSIFMAKGPLFKEHKKVEPFNTIDLFKLFCKILKIDQTPQTPGSSEIINELLKDDKVFGGPGVAGIVGIIIVCVLAVAVTIYFVNRYRKRKNLYITTY